MHTPADSTSDIRLRRQVVTGYLLIKRPLRINADCRFNILIGVNRRNNADCPCKVVHTPTNCNRPTALTPTSRLVCAPKSAGV